MSHLDTVREFVQTGRPELAHPVRTKIRFAKSSEEISISRSSDGKWRYGYHTVYSNGSFVNGDGCDASGYVIRDAAIIQRLEELLGDPRTPMTREQS